MELTFTKNLNNEFVAEFEATADFNLHVENILPRDITLLQRTAGGKYDVIRDFPQNPPLSNIMDYDCTALIYPKTIKVVCATEPSYASVVSSGEVTEIKSQDKEVEVTSNGTLEVAPDAGFAYLNSVNVKVNVPPSGGSGGGSSSSWRYYDYTKCTTEQLSVSLDIFGMMIKRVYSGQIEILGSSRIQDNDEILAFAIDVSQYLMQGSEKRLVSDVISMVEQEVGKLPEITEEEFYAV